MPDNETKVCADCGETKPVSDFYRDGASGRPRSYCKPCHSAKGKEQYRKYADTGIDRVYSYSLERNYGITLAEYNEQLRKQAHRCAICRRPESAVTRATGTRRRLAVDHDHASGRIRGLLCYLCNRLVWALEDNHLMLDGILKYIERHQASIAAGHGSNDG